MITGARARGQPPTEEGNYNRAKRPGHGPCLGRIVQELLRGVALPRRAPWPLHSRNSPSPSRCPPASGSPSEARPWPRRRRRKSTSSFCPFRCTCPHHNSSLNGQSSRRGSTCKSSTPYWKTSKRRKCRCSASRGNQDPQSGLGASVPSCSFSCEIE